MSDEAIVRAIDALKEENFNFQLTLLEMLKEIRNELHTISQIRNVNKEAKYEEKNNMSELDKLIKKAGPEDIKKGSVADKSATYYLSEL